jgi:hypothetical protein
MKKSELKKMIREEYKKTLIKESREKEIWDFVSKPIDTLSEVLKLAQKDATDANWKKALSALIVDLSKFEDKCGDYNQKLGIINLK